jgi:hypothetical protein
VKNFLLILACIIVSYVFLDTAMERYLTPVPDPAHPALDSLGLPALPPGLKWVPADPSDTMPPLWHEIPRAQYLSHA